MDQLHAGTSRLRRVWRHQGGSATLETAALAMIVFALLTAVIVGLNSRGAQIGNSIGTVLIHYINGGQAAQPAAANIASANVATVNVGTVNVGTPALGLPALLQAAQTQNGFHIDLTVLAGVIGAVAGVIGALAVIGIAALLGVTVGAVVLVVALVAAAVVGAVLGIVYFLRTGDFTWWKIALLGFAGGVLVGLIAVAWEAGLIAAAWRAVAAGLTRLWGAITSGLTRLWAAITSRIAAFWQALRGGIASAWRGLVSRVSSGWQAARNWVQKNLLSRLGRQKLWKAIEEWEKGLVKKVYRWMLRNPVLSRLPRWLLKAGLKSFPALVLYGIGRVLLGLTTGQWPRPIDLVVEILPIIVLAGIPAVFAFKVLVAVLATLFKAWQVRNYPAPTLTPQPTPQPTPTPTVTPSPTSPPTSTPTPTPTTTPSPTSPPTSTPSPQPTP